VSDQDFFFDEDEQPKAEEKSASAKKTGGAGRSAASATTTTQTVSMAVAALIGVIALLGGVIIGILLPTGGTSTVAPTTSPAGQTAPQLSPDQMGGELPEGHPDIGAMGGDTGTGGSEEATSN
jgi:hypothetical protein